MSCKSAVVFVAVGILSASEMSLGAERLFSYQAQVSDTSGPIHDRFVKVQFRAFDALSGGTQRGATLVRNIDAGSVQNGTFVVNDLDIDQLGLPDDASPTYLELAVCADDLGCTPATLTPRHRITFSALAAAALALGGSAKSEDDRSLTLRASLGDGSALVRAGDEGGASVQMRLESVGTTGRTALAIDEGAADEVKVSVYREATLANRGGYTPLKFGVGPFSNQLLLSAPTGPSESEYASIDSSLDGGPAALRFKIGDQDAVHIGTNRVADFRAGQATITSGDGTSLALSAGDGANAASISASDGGSPKSLQLKTGSTLAMEIGTSGVAEFFAPEVRARDFVGIDATASRSESAAALTAPTEIRIKYLQAAANTAWARAMEAKTARGDVTAAASAEAQGTGAPEMQMLIGSNVISRWAGRSGIPPNQDPFANAPNFTGGSAANYYAPGVYGATIVGGGGSSFDADPSCPVEDPNCWYQANRVLSDFGAVVAGAGNEAGQASFVGGGINNTASDDHAFVGGGRWNRATQRCATIVGGENNITSGYGFIGAGFDNDSSSQIGVGGSGPPVICGGQENLTTHLGAFIGGGRSNQVTQSFGSVVGGTFNVASGQDGAIPGGERNTAGGRGSFAAGRFARVRDATAVGGGDTDGDQGCFAWGDSFDESFSARLNYINSTGPNQFIVRASGGLWLGEKLLDTPDAFWPGNENAVIPSGRFIQTTAGSQSCADTCNSTYDYATQLADLTTCIDGCNSYGAYLSTGGTWTNASDKDSKENIEPVAPMEILDRVLDLNISRWNYKVERDSVQHIGPMAQDFHSAFGVGDSEKTIGTIDADGVALAAIQGLHQLVQEKDCEIEELKSQIPRMRELEERLARMEAMLAKQAD